MSNQFIISGYIESLLDKEEELAFSLEEFSFDSSGVFEDIFSSPKKGFLSLMISFAGSYKNFDDDLIDWRDRFEELLKNLYAKSASVKVERELDGEIMTIDYLPIIPSSAKASNEKKMKWARYIKNEDGDEIEEFIFI